MSGPHIAASKALHVAIVGVGLVGKELMSQMLASRYPFQLVGLCNSKRMLLSTAQSPLCGDLERWQDALAKSNTPADLGVLQGRLARLVGEGKRVVVVDNTASEEVALSYPGFLDAGVHVVTPNKKAFSGDVGYYLRLLGEKGTVESERDEVERGRFLNESTVGAGLPIISTLKDLVETGDKVLFSFF